MANKMRWRYGDTNPVQLEVDASTAVEIGDLVYQNTNLALPASELADQGTPALNQEMFHDAFAGVAMQCSPAGEAGPVRVATTGVFEFDCDAATFEVGDLIAVAENAAGDALEDQKVIATGSEPTAIGRCVRRAPNAVSTVLVDVVSTLVKGGVQAAA
ncbi:MAG: hypothetical protein KDA37_02440 [Planctomycetales bacterium]|nr:hypothetical protein [Planctomycetales bacterium]